LAPAIRLAREGIPVYERMRLGLNFKAEQLRRWPGGAVFLPEGEVPDNGTIIRLPGLADIMERLVAEGAPGFYDGQVAAMMVAAVRANGGIWSREDLAGYRIVEREPLYAEFDGGLSVTVPPPPSAGGVALIQALNILSGWKLEAMDPAERAHLVVEALRRAFRDRGHLGDPDYVDMPLELLLHPAYAAGLAATLRMDRATPSEVFAPLHVDDGGTQTTHFSVIDAEGNRVAVTQTLNSWFGSGYVVPGLDLILNNEMDDFTIKPGERNLYALVGSEPNIIAPGKRMLSSMAPTFLESARGVAVLGTPGGSRIVSMVLLAALAWMDGADAADIAALPRYHHQYLPDQLVHEPEAFTPELAEALRARGHELQESRRLYGNMAIVTWDFENDRVEAASDPRGEVAGWVY
jgi:gamma-glutamyltranspeptidase / glutathione hydrolase